MELSKRSEAKVYSYQEYKDLVLECADKQTTARNVLKRLKSMPKG